VSRVRTSVVGSSGISRIGLLYAEVKVGPPLVQKALKWPQEISQEWQQLPVSPASSPTTNGFGMVASDGSSSICCGTWAEGMDPGGATTYKLCNKMICPL